MHEQIEEIIKKNLPEKKEIIPIQYEPNPINTKIAYHEQTLRFGFNQALSQINTSLIADEVLKVVVEKIKEEIEKYEPAYENEDIAIVDFGKKLLNKIKEL